MKRQIQLPLPSPRTWGGKRLGAGRRPAPTAGTRSAVPHVSRGAHHSESPVLVTVRAALGCLRAQSVGRAIHRVFRRMAAEIPEGSRPPFAVTHFSIQSTHIHMIVEAKDDAALSRGMRSLDTRLALAINRVLDRRGQVVADRWHGHE